MDLVAPAGWASAILGIESPGALEVQAVEGPGPILLERGAALDVEIVGVFYGASLAELAIFPGPIADTTAARPVPPGAIASLSRALVGGSLDVQKMLSPSDPRVTRLRLPLLSDAACALDGGCLALGGGERRCESACDIPVPIEPAPPAAPVPPRIAPCPPSWIESADGCSSPAVITRVTCAAGDVQRYGETTCASVGQACPPGDWPLGAPAGAAFVHPQQAPGPGGEVSFATITDAIASGSRTIVLSRGAHAGGGLSGQALLGLCARDTLVAGALALDGGQATNLRVREALVATGSVSLSGLILDAGMQARGHVDASDLAITGAVSASDGADVTLARTVMGGANADGPATRLVLRDAVVAGEILANRGAHVEITRAELLAGNIGARDDGAIDAEDVAIRRSVQIALAVVRGAITGRRIAVDSSARSAISLDGGAITLEDVEVVDRFDGPNGLMAIAQNGGTLSVSRATFRGFPQFGFVADGLGTRLVISDASIRDARGMLIVLAPAITAQAGARLEMQRVSVARVQTAGLVLLTSATATVTDLTIEDVRLTEDGASGVLVNTSRLSLSRAKIARIDGTAVRADASAVVVEDIDIEGVESPSESVANTGFHMGAAGELTVTRARVRRTKSRAFETVDGSSATLLDIDIRDTYGAGVVTKQFGKTRLDRARIERIQNRGLDVDEMSELIGADIWVSEVTLGDGGLALGMDVSDGSKVQLERLTLMGAVQAALRVVVESPEVAPVPPVVNIQDGTFAGSGIGVQVLLRPGERGSVHLEDVRLIRNLTDFDP